MVILPAAISALPTLGTVFILADRLHRCKIPQLPNDTYASQGPWHDALINRSIPLSTEDGKEYDECHLYKYTNSSGNITESLQSCHSWIYDESTLQNTVSSEFDLVCDKVVFQSTASMVYMAGLLFGSILFGAIADMFGRKPSLCVAISILFVSNLGLVFAPDYISFIILRFFVGISNVGIFGQCFVIGMELVGKPRRVFTGTIIEIFWCFGELLVAGIAYFLPDWRHIQIAITALVGIFLPYWILIPESLRWLFSTGKSQKANELLLKIAKVNKVKLPENIIINLQEESSSSFFKPLGQLLTSPTLLLRTGIISLCWFVSNIGYFGLTLNSGRIGGNIYVNYVVSAVMELVAYIACLCLVDRIGRRAMFCTSMLLGGISCLCTIFTVMYAPDLSWTTVALSNIGKLGVSASFAVIFIFTPELYPTKLRGSTLGLTNFIGRAGGVVSPYIADLVITLIL
ncbi:hypothetical protein FSP39_017559 [Pinctada imbricata]|uniref:Major facilitator superfamily (MFS) profile domain-containing protein n=1 Tax=Pinctada imbricata TaxID=66713 RepID=A0AA88YPS7_PINIB|nr:hypothetical protein FSP39_017559 [Pinctada imbricata]